MEIIVQKYEIEFGGKTYNISVQPLREKLRLKLEETNTEHPISYYADYALNELTQLSSLFASISSISEAQRIFENIIMDQKVEIEHQGEYIYLKVAVKKEGVEEYFTILLSILDPNANKTQSMFQSTQISYGNNGYQNNYQNDYQNSYQNYSYQSMFQNNVSSQDELAQQYLSLLQNNNNNGQAIYSTTETTTTQQYSQIPQITEMNQANENISYNTSENNYNYEKVEKYKTKKKKLIN